MKKGLLIALLIIFLGGASFVVWQFALDTPVVARKALDAVPKETSIILRAKDLKDAWKNDIKSHPSWKANQHIPAFQSLNEKFELLDSLSTVSPELKSILVNRETYLATAMTSPSSYDMLVISELDKQGLSLFEAFKTKVLSKHKLVERVYNESKIYDLVISKDQHLSFTVIDGILILSETPTLVERSALQLKSEGGFSNNKMISQLWKTIDRSATANIFINFRQLGELNKIYLKDYDAFLSDSPTMGNWCELDLTIKDHGAFLTGLIATSDSLSNFFYSFRNQKPMETEFEKLLPQNTAYFISNSISSRSSFVKDYSSVLDKHQLLYSYENNLTNIKSRYGKKAISDLSSAIGNNWIVFITEPAAEEYTDHLSLAVQIKDIEKDPKTIKQAFLAIDKDSSFTEVFQNYEIGEFQTGNVINAIFNQKLDLNRRVFFTFIEDYLILSNSVGNIKHIINAYSKGITLSKSNEYQNFLNKFPDKNNFYAYFNLAYGSKVLTDNLKTTFANSFIFYKDSVSAWDKLGFMVTGGSELMYTNAYLAYTPQKEEMTLSLHSKKLDAPIAMPPVKVLNHYTKENELLVQDEENNLYLLNADGSKIWSINIGERIISDIYQVDRYKNKKLQYLFNTKSSIYLIDRNGESVEDFPKTIPNRATNGIAVFDYAKNRNYRIFCANESNKILCFDIRGKKVQGWSEPKIENKVKQPLVWLNKKGKDYLVAVDELGKVRILNRRGDDRIIVKHKLPAGRHYHLNDQETIENTAFVCTDSIGTVYQLNFADTKTTTPIKAFSEQHQFQYADINADGFKDFIFLDEENLEAFKLTKSSIFKTDFDIGHATNLKIFNGLTVFTDDSENKTYLLDESGEIIKGFPVEGSTPMSVLDLDDDGNYELITGDTEGNVYFYSFVK